MILADMWRRHVAFWNEREGPEALALLRITFAAALAANLLEQIFAGVLFELYALPGEGGIFPFDPPHPPLSLFHLVEPTATVVVLLVVGQLVAAHPHPIRGGKQPRILFGTQAGTKPPRFVLFASGFIEAGYRRFIERRLREEFGFDGTPIHISVRVREKRGKKK